MFSKTILSAALAVGLATGVATAESGKAQKPRMSEAYVSSQSAQGSMGGMMLPLIILVMVAAAVSATD